MYSGTIMMGSFSTAVYAITRLDEEERIIVGWSCTRNDVQLLTEGYASFMNVKLAEYDLHEVQEGARTVKYFDKFYDLIRDEYKSDLNKTLEEYPEYELVITGHSLGGALSVQAAVDCILSENVTEDKLFVYTYGAPRVGNYKFTKIIGDR